MITCGKCGLQGHVARDCQWESDISGRPAWCGECDKETRLIDHGDYAQRCHKCWAWPARGTRFHQMFPQHRKCGGCGGLVYTFDAAGCGKHQPVGIDSRGHKIPVTVKDQP
jgi:hypothetical protein